MGLKVLLYVPNIIGYIRLTLLFTAALYIIDAPMICLILYTTATCLDALDGYAARKLKQISTFGAWFDVVVDLLGRGILWTYLYQHWGYLIMAVEWLTFISTHSKGPDWKTMFEETPWIVRKVMQNGFRSPLGALTIAGVHALPALLYAHTTGLMVQYMVPVLVQQGAIVLLVTGRLLCLCVEVYCILGYVRHLIDETPS